MDQQTSLLIMNELYACQKYAECINAFEIYVTQMKEYKEMGQKDMKIFVNGSKTQLIHVGQFRLVTLSLLRLGTREAYEQMKRLVFNRDLLFDSKMSPKSLICCFILALEQVKEFKKKRFCKKIF